MFYRNIFYSTFTCILLLNSTRSNILQENIDYATENVEKPLDIKERIAIADEYIQKFPPEVANWIDPHPSIKYIIQQPRESLNEQIEQVEPSNVPKLPESTLNEQTLFPTSRQTCAITTKLPNKVYIYRWLKKLVLKIEKESKFVPTAISFPMDTIMFNNLKELSTAESLEISQLDELICKMIDQSSIIRIKDFDWMIAFDYAKDLVMPIIVMVFVAVGVYTIYKGILHRPIFTTLCCVIVSSVSWRWMHLYKQRQAERLAELATMTIPTLCRKSEFGLIEHFREYLRSFFTTNGCVKYYEALTVDPFWEVSITVAISETVTSMIFHSLSTSSHYLNLAIKQVFDGLTIFTVILILIFIFLILLMLCNYRVRSPLGALEPNHAYESSPFQDLKSSKALKFLNSSFKIFKFNLVKFKLSSNTKGESLQRSLEQDIVHMNTYDVLKQDRIENCIQNFKEKQCASSKVKDLSSDQLSFPPSRISTAPEPSTSDDDISVIDSDENTTETENSLLEQILLGCQWNRQCSFPLENLSITNFKNCGGSLLMKNMDDSFHFSPKGCDYEDNVAR